MYVGLAAAVLIAIFSYFQKRLLNSDSFSSSPPANAVARILSFENDARHKKADDLVWYPAERAQWVSVNDSVFAGNKSTIHIQLKTGGDIDLQPNSMMTFRTLNGVTLPNFIQGTFELNINGSVKLMINDRVTLIEGNQARVRLNIKEGETSVTPVILRGKAIAETLDFQQEKKRDLRGITLRVEPPKILPTPLSLRYIWHESDLFEMPQNEWVWRRKAAEDVEVPFFISWSDGPGKPVFIDQSGPSGARLAFKSQDQNPFKLNRLFTGENRFRLSWDNETWSSVETVLVKPEFWQNEIRWLDDGDGTKGPTTVTRGKSLQLSWQATRSGRHYLFEVSRDKNFSPTATTITPLHQQRMQFKAVETGVFYVRVRAISDAHEVGYPSRVREISCLDLHKSIPPHVDTPPVVVRPLAKKVARPPRTPASPEIGPKESGTSRISLTQTEPPAIPPVSQRSLVQFEGAGFGMVSSAQGEQGMPSPLAGILGLRFLTWFGANGVEASVKKKAFDYNAAAQVVSPEDFEARYYRRVCPSWPSWSLIRGYCASGAIGYEAYRNFGSSFFIPHYEVLKIGAMLRFPFLENWETGGEVLYGLTRDGSHKYELSGLLDYRFGGNWAFGAGYRVHLFEAKTTQSSPSSTLPYREAYGELYSLLKYLF